MMFALFTAALAGENRTQSAAEYWTMWNDFQKIRHSSLPDYVTETEHNDRFEIFKDNVDKANRHNALGKSWTLGVTPFADLTQEEFGEKIVGSYCNDNFQENAKLKKAKTKLREGRRRAIENLGNPSSVDWTTAGKVTLVKDQGQCGSCWAFSTTGSIEARSAIKNNNSPISLSEQELVDCDNNDSGCNGGAMQNGFAYAEGHSGLCLESDYSYTAADGTCKSSTCTHYDPVSSYDDVSYGESYLETAVAAGPVSIAIEADQMSFQLYTGGVFEGDCGTKLDHGVLAVGYDNSGSNPYWKVKNSWGGNWGESGYIRMCKNCGKNGSAGQCGIAADASYPVI